jgi:molecular chaperone GrpE
VSEIGSPTGPGDPAASVTDVPPCDAITAVLHRMSSLVEDFHERSAHREKVIDRLHEENVGLRAGVRDAILAPVVADLVRLYDGLRQQAARLLAESDGRIGALLASFADDVALALDRCGVEIVDVEAGEPFDAERHTAVSVVPAPGAADHNTLAEVLSVALRDSGTGRLRRPARVRVYSDRSPVRADGADGEDS